jgi:hypothetical protein
MHFQLWILEMHLQNYKFKKKIVDFANEFSWILQMHFQILEIHFYEFWKFIFIFWKCFCINFENSISIFPNIKFKIIKILEWFTLLSKTNGFCMDFHNFLCIFIKPKKCFKFKKMWKSMQNPWVFYTFVKYSFRNYI